MNVDYSENPRKRTTVLFSQLDELIIYSDSSRSVSYPHRLVEPRSSGSLDRKYQPSGSRVYKHVGSLTRQEFRENVYEINMFALVSPFTYWQNDYILVIFSQYDHMPIK